VFCRVCKQINEAKCLAALERLPPALAEIVVCSFKFAPAETDTGTGTGREKDPKAGVRLS